MSRKVLLRDSLKQFDANDDVAYYLAKHYADSSLRILLLCGALETNYNSDFFNNCRGEQFTEKALKFLVSIAENEIKTNSSQIDYVFDDDAISAIAIKESYFKTHQEYAKFSEFSKESGATETFNELLTLFNPHIVLVANNNVLAGLNANLYAMSGKLLRQYLRDRQISVFCLDIGCQKQPVSDKLSKEDREKVLADELETLIADVECEQNGGSCVFLDADCEDSDNYEKLTESDLCDDDLIVWEHIGEKIPRIKNPYASMNGRLAQFFYDESRIQGLSRVRYIVDLLKRNCLHSNNDINNELRLLASLDFELNSILPRNMNDKVGESSKKRADSTLTTGTSRNAKSVYSRINQEYKQKILGVKSRHNITREIFEQEKKRLIKDASQKVKEFQTANGFLRANLNPLRLDSDPDLNW